MVGTRYWAKQALTSVLSHLQANSMRQVLLQPAATQDKPEVGALMVVSLPVVARLVCMVTGLHSAMS